MTLGMRGLPWFSFCPMLAGFNFPSGILSNEPSVLLLSRYDYMALFSYGSWKPRMSSLSASITAWYYFRHNTESYLFILIQFLRCGQEPAVKSTSHLLAPACLTAVFQISVKITPNCTSFNCINDGLFIVRKDNNCAFNVTCISLLGYSQWSVYCRSNAP